MKSVLRLVLQPSLLTAALLLSVLVGCRPAARIQTYEAPKLPEKKKPDRMLGAIAFQEDTAWFFKSTAAREVADAIEPEFKSLVQSVRFGEDGQPQWELPSGWSKSDEVVQLRYATLKANANGKQVDVTISKLPFSGNAEDQYVLNNVNRWRGQLGERPAMMIELQRDLEKLPMASGEEALLVRLDGKQKGGPPSSQMPVGHPPVDAGNPVGPPPSGTVRPANSPLDFETPEGWAPGQAGGMRKAAFNVADGENVALVTVIDLPGNSGTLADNVNRWRTQVELSAASEDEIEAAAQTVDVGGQPGRYVELVGPQDTILGVIVPTGEKTWFIKMRGEKELTASEKLNFEKFIKSLQLP